MFIRLYKLQETILNIKILVAAGLLSSFSTCLYAQQAIDEKGWYGGIFGGATKAKIGDGVLPITGSTASSLSKDETAGVFGVALGYDFSPQWAVEGGYVDNGKLSARRTSTAGTIGTFGAQVEGTALFLAGIGKLPLQNGFYLFGKLGLARTTTKAQLDTTGGFALPAGIGTNPKRTESNLLWGLGAGYDFSRTLGLRFDFTRINNVGDASTGEGDVNTITGAVKFRF